MRLQVRSSVGDVSRVFEAWAEGIDDWSLRPEPGAAGAQPIDPRSLWERLDDVWRESREELFDSYGASEGAPWPLYSETEEAGHYRHAKAAIVGLSYATLEDDRLRWGGPNRLMRSMIGQSSEYYFRFSTLSMEVGSTVPYAVNHDRGIGHGPEWGGAAPIPQRQLLVVGVATMAEIEDRTVAYVADRLVSLTGAVKSFSGREALVESGLA